MKPVPRQKYTLIRFLVAGGLAIGLVLDGSNPAIAAISATGNVLPAYPGASPDPWNVGTELIVGDFETGSLQVAAGSDVTSSGGTAGFDPDVIGSITVTGAGSTWVNSQDLLLGVFGIGKLDVVQGGRVDNQDASVGHISGIGQVTVSGSGSTWTNATELVVGTSGVGSLTIESQGRVRSAEATVGLNNSSAGLVAIDGQQSTWEITNSLSVGDAINGGIASVSLTGAGSRLYVGAAAVAQGATLPIGHTAIIVSKSGGPAQLSIFEGNSVHNVGSSYIGVGSGESGIVEVNGESTSWLNDGGVFVGMNGAGTLSLVAGGTVSSSGPIAVGNAGLVIGTGALIGGLSNTGIVRPGQSIGAITVEGNFSQSPAGKLWLDLAGKTAGTFDTLDVSGTATLGGTLEVDLSGLFSPQLGDSFEVLSAAGGLSGKFSAADLPMLGAGKMWRIAYSANTASLVVKIAGDYNDNGVVDAADYTVWRSLLGSTLDPRADGDTNGVVNINDYQVWKANFGLSAGAGAAFLSAPPVPEPSVLALLAATTLFVGGRRQYR